MTDERPAEPPTDPPAAAERRNGEMVRSDRGALARHRRLADEDLMAMAVRREESAFQVLYERHGRIAFGLAYRMMGDRASAEDVVQDAMIAAWRRCGSYRPDRGSVRNWILSITHHRAIDRLRSAATHDRRRAPDDEVIPDRGAPDSFTLVWQSAQREEIKTALAEIPDEQRRVIELGYFGGYTHVEISDLLDVPLGTVKARMRLGLQKLRASLSPTLASPS